MNYGYAKYILDVDLSTGDITKKPVDVAMMSEWLGGMGYGLKVLFDELEPGTDPLSPENILIFTTGPLVGTLVPGAGRVDILARSPLTGMLGAASGGGHWAPVLKYAGYEAIILRGQARRLVYLWIDDDKVELRDASAYQGLDTWETVDAIRAEFPDSGPDSIRVLSIGPAGENRVRYASITVDYQNSASRCGMGAVMASKNVKAVAVRGSGVVGVARPRDLEEVVCSVVAGGDTSTTAVSAGSDSASAQANLPAYLTTRSLAHPRLSQPGLQPGKNWQVGVLPNWEKRTLKVGQQYVRLPVGEGCHTCHVTDGCIQIKEGKYKGVRLGDAHMQFIQSFGGACAMEDLAAIFRAQELCEQLGLDAIDAAGTIAFAMELYERGLLTLEDTGGIALNWGDEDLVLDLLHKISHRDGIGDLLAEGSRLAAERLGRDTARYAMHVGGMTPDVVEQVRHVSVHAFGDLTSPRGGDNLRTTHASGRWENAPKKRPKGCEGMSEAEFSRWWAEHVDMFDDLKEKIYGNPPAMGPYSPTQRAQLIKWSDEHHTVWNCLGVCFITGVTVTPLAKAMSAVLGRDVSAVDLMRIGEKVFNLAWSFNAREGITRKDIDWPERFYTEPIPEGPEKGAVLSRAAVEETRNAYYEARGWDRQTGLPTLEKLVALGMGDVAEALKEVFAAKAGAK